MGNKKCRIYAACGVLQTPRIETESEEKTMGLIKENGQKFIMIGGYVYVRWKKNVPFRFEGA